MNLTKAQNLLAALKNAKKSGFIKNIPQMFDYIFLHGYLDVTESKCQTHNSFRYVFSDYSQLSMSDTGFLAVFELAQEIRLFSE